MLDSTANPDGPWQAVSHSAWLAANHLFFSFVSQVTGCFGCGGGRNSFEKHCELASDLFCIHHTYGVYQCQQHSAEGPFLGGACCPPHHDEKACEAVTKMALGEMASTLPLSLIGWVNLFWDNFKQWGHIQPVRAMDRISWPCPHGQHLFMQVAYM